MASKKVDEMEPEPSTSKVSKDGVSSLRRLADALAATVTEIDIDELVRALNDEYKKVKKNPLVPDESLLRAKSNSASTELRVLGDQMFKLGDVNRAVAYYTRSISFAEDGSEELTLAYAKRSAPLHKVPFYDHCVEDINRALAGRCPPSVKQKLEKRKYQCFIGRRKANTKNQTKPGLVTSPLYKMMRMESMAAASNSADDPDETELSNQCKFENAHLPNASSKIRLGYDAQKWGRYIEATEDLEAGEIITSQKWFTAFLIKEMLCECCSYCFKLCPAMIPCLTCTEMMYCSDDCRKLAFDSYHRLECKIVTPFFKNMDKSIENPEFYPVRELLIGTEQGAQLGNLMQKMTIRDIMGTDFPASETFVADYATAMRLPKTYSRDRVKENVPFAARTIAVLEYVGFFDGDPSFRADPEHQDTLTEAQIFTAFLLLNHRVGMSTHMFCIKVLLDTEKMVEEYKMGSCYCTFNTIFNHSCDPNVNFFMHNREIVTYTKRPIAKGEELLISYGTSYLTDDYGTRISTLRLRHGFICQCVACIYKWPTNDVLGKNELEFCDHINPKKARSELKTLLSPIADESKFKSLPVKQILHIALDVCKWLSTNMEQPSYEYGYIQSLLSIFMTLRYDQFNKFSQTEGATQYAYLILRRIADRTRTDVTGTSESASSKTTKEPLLCTKFLK